MDALENILNRVSARTLAEPYPSKDEMNTVYKAALRAPDHAWLRTSSFIEVKGKGLDKLSDIFINYGKSIPDISDEVLDKYKNGGVIENVREPSGREFKRIHVFDWREFMRFKAEGRDGVKMFGMTTLSAEAIREFQSKVLSLDDIRYRYFHDIFCSGGADVLHTSVEMSSDSFSFNTVSELEIGKNRERHHAD